VRYASAGTSPPASLFTLRRNIDPVGRGLRLGVVHGHMPAVNELYCYCTKALIMLRSQHCAG
jgi:hypothetical protein